MAIDPTINPRGSKVEDVNAINFEEVQGTGKDLTAALKNSSKEVTQASSKVSKAMGVLGTTFDTVMKFATKHLDAAFDRVVNAYEATATNTMTKLQMSQKELTVMWGTYAEKISREGLKTMTTAREMVEELQSTLSTGARGEFAIRKAEYDLIAKKLVPTLNTSSRRLTDVSLVMGNPKFTEGLAAFQHYLDRNGDYSSSEEYLNQMVDTFSSTVYRWAAQMEGSTEKNNEDIWKVLQASADVMGQFGGDSIQSFINILDSTLKQGVGGVYAQLSGLNTAEGVKSISTDLSGRSAGDFLSDLVQGVGKYLASTSGDSELAYQTIVAEYGDMSRETFDMLSAVYYDYTKRGVALEDLSDEVVKLVSGYEGPGKELDEVAEKDYYVTATQGWENATENMVTKLAVESTYIPHFDELFSGVTTILSSILSAISITGGMSALGGGGLGGVAGAASSGVGRAIAGHLGTIGAGAAIGYGLGKYIQSTEWGQKAADYVADNWMPKNLKVRKEEEARKAYYKAATASMLDKASQSWYEYFNDPALLASRSDWSAAYMYDGNNDGLPDNEVANKAFQAWRSDNESDSFTISDYMNKYMSAEGSHAFGLSYVPHDDYLANLHEGETVLSKKSADALRALQQLGVPSTAVADINSKGISDKISLVTKAIENQTEELIARLDIIIEGITSSRPSGVSASSVY